MAGDEVRPNPGLLESSFLMCLLKLMRLMLISALQRCV